jgi:HAE1 family hydrophobic/amphiphilic exporter-1
VFYGMLASTCLAVLFVPSFYVVMQRIEEWRSGKTKSAAKAAEAEPAAERVG